MLVAKQTTPPTPAVMAKEIPMGKLLFYSKIVKKNFPFCEK